MAKTRQTLDDGTTVFTGLGRGRYVVNLSPKGLSQPKLVQVEPDRQATVDLPVGAPEQAAPATAPAGSQPAPPASPVPASDKRGAGAPDANGQLGPSGVFGAAQTYKLVGEVKFTTLKDAAGGMRVKATRGGKGHVGTIAHFDKCTVQWLMLDPNGDVDVKGPRVRGRAVKQTLTDVWVARWINPPGAQGDGGWWIIDANTGQPVTRRDGWAYGAPQPGP